MVALSRFNPGGGDECGSTIGELDMMDVVEAADVSLVPKERTEETARGVETPTDPVALDLGVRGVGESSSLQALRAG